MISKFSIHPKLAAIIDLILNIATLFIFPLINNWQFFGIWFLIRALLWAFFIRLVYYPPELSRLRHFFSLIFFNFGTIISLSIFVEWQVSWYILLIVFILFSAVSFWLLPAGESKLLFYQKPFRRWIFLMDVFGLVGFWCGIFAVMSFQLVSWQHYLWLNLLGTSITSIISLWWWRVYDIKYSKRFWLSLIACFVMVFELGWIVLRWPIGFLASGIIITWFWYVLWIMMRFNLTKEGINWKKQKLFLILSVILFILFIFLIKWK